MSALRDRLRLWRHHLRFALDERLLPPPELPARPVPLRVNVVVHAERLARPEAFRSLRAFARDFRRERGVPITCCVITPRCPWAALQLRQEGLDDAGYAARVRDLAEDADIGYHGHFFREAASPGAARETYDRDFGGGGEAFFAEEWEYRLDPVGPRSHDAGVVERQMAGELAWFSAQGIAPKVYLGGWWYMTADLAALLESHGFLADCTIRKGHPDTFGGRYLPDGEVPERGTPWMLPPTRGVAEIQSVFYPVDSPRRLAPSYRALFSGGPAEPRAVALPLHEGEIACYGREIRAHLDLLSRAGAAWTRVEEMAREARAACGVA